MAKRILFLKLDWMIIVMTFHMIFSFIPTIKCIQQEDRCSDREYDFIYVRVLFRQKMFSIHNFLQSWIEKEGMLKKAHLRKKKTVVDKMIPVHTRIFECSCFWECSSLILCVGQKRLDRQHHVCRWAIYFRNFKSSFLYTITKTKYQT